MEGIKKRDSSFTKCKNNLKNILLKNDSIQSIYIDILEKDDFFIKTNIRINNEIKTFNIPLIKKNKKMNENSLKNLNQNKISTSEFIDSDVESEKDEENNKSESIYNNFVDSNIVDDCNTIENDILYDQADELIVNKNIISSISDASLAESNICENISKSSNSLNIEFNEHPPFCDVNIDTKKDEISITESITKNVSFIKEHYDIIESINDQDDINKIKNTQNFSSVSKLDDQYDELIKNKNTEINISNDNSNGIEYLPDDEFQPLDDSDWKDPYYTEYPDAFACDDCYHTNVLLEKTTFELNKILLENREIEKKLIISLNAQKVLQERIIKYDSTKLLVEFKKTNENFVKISNLSQEPIKEIQNIIETLSKMNPKKVSEFINKNIINYENKFKNYLNDIIQIKNKQEKSIMDL